MATTRDHVVAAVSEFAERTNIRTSRPATELVALVVSAIVEDPHPRWRAAPGFSPASLELAQDWYLRALPLFLTQVAQQALRGEREQITTFDVLHWLTSHLDSICTIPK